MEDLLQILHQSRDQSARLREALASKHSVSRDAHPLVGFGYCFNHVTWALELCDHYYVVWSGDKYRASIPAERVDQQIKENAYKLSEVNKAAFILIISGMEYSAVEANREHKEVLSLNWDRTQYLSGVIGKSHALGLLDEPIFEKWTCLIKVRNSMVHNNGHATENLKVEFPGGPTVEMIQGEMIQGDPVLFFVSLTSWVVPAYANWCDKFLERVS
jgi:hypothetical protein